MAIRSGCLVLGVILAAGACNVQADPRTVLIGLAAPMSGLSGNIGVSLERASELAIKDINETKPVIGGEPVVFKLLPLDDRADPRTGEWIADYFVKSKVAAVIAHWNSGVGIPASKIYAAAGIPHLSPGVTAPAFTLQGFETTFRLVPHDGDGARLTAEYVLNELKARTIVVIDDRTVFGATYAAEFEKSVAALNGKVSAHYSISSKSSDFNQILRQASALNPDVLFFGGIDAQAAQLARDMRRLGLTASLVTSDGVVGQTFLDIAGPAGENTVAIEPGRPSYKGPQWARFQSAWKARYKEEIYLYAPFAYDAVRVVAAAMNSANSTDTAKVTAELHKIRYQGISGNIAFDKKGDLTEPVFTIYAVKNGRWRAVRTIGGKE